MDDHTEKPKDPVEQAARGRSERTPLLLGAGVYLVVGGLVAVVLTIALAAYLIA